MIFKIITDLGDFILLINVLLFAKGFSANGKAFRIFTCYLITMFIIQITSSVLQYLSINNLFLSHFYFILQFILLSFFYLNLSLNGLQSKIVKIGFVICLSALTVQYVLDNSLLLKFNLFEIFITSFLLVIYTTFHLYNLLNEKREFYYINLGILLYLFGSTVLFLVGNLINSLTSESNKITWILNVILYVIYQLFIFIEWKKSFFKKHKIDKNE